MRAPFSALYGHRAYYGWLVVGVVFLASAISIGPAYAFGLFIEPLENSFGWQRTAISASLSFAAVGSLTSPILGRIMDRYGARPLLTGSLVIMGTSFLLRPLMTELWHWYVLSFFQYLAFSGSTNLPVGRLVGIWFHRSRGRVMGLATMGNNFGGVTLPLMTGFLLASGNWQAAYLLLAGLTFLIAFLSLAVVREYPSQGRHESSEAGAGQATGPVLAGWTVSQAVRSRSFYALALSFMLGAFTYSAVLPQVADHLTVEGMSRTTVPFAVSLLAALGMVGKVAFGYLSERFTARRMMMVSLSGQIVFIFLMVGFPAPPIAWLAVPLFGLFMGSYGALINLVVQETFGLKYFGTISGMISMTSAVSFFAGPIIAGQSYDLTDSYGPGFIAVAVMFAIAVLSLTQVVASKPR